MRSRVTPGVSSTMESRFPMSLLNSMDLPTLGRPTMATMGFTGAHFLSCSDIHGHIIPSTSEMASRWHSMDAKKEGRCCSSLPIHMGTSYFATTDLTTLTSRPL